MTTAPGARPRRGPVLQALERRLARYRFPTTKRELEAALRLEGVHARDILHALSPLPDRRYDDPSDVTAAAVALRDGGET